MENRSAHIDGTPTGSPDISPPVTPRSCRTNNGICPNAPMKKFSDEMFTEYRTGKKTGENDDRHGHLRDEDDTE